MFLDDKLYQMVKETIIDSTEAFNDLLEKLYKECNESYIDQVVPGADKKVISAAIERSFNAYDSFAKKLTKENHFLAEEFTTYSYRNAFIRTPNLRKALENIKS